jgi:hypothetical protein
MMRIQCMRMLILIMVSCAFQQTESAPSFRLTEAEESPSCDLSSLPADIQSTLKRDLSSWIVQTPERLSKSARSTWDARRPHSCPGMAIGMFEGMKYPAYALLLVPVNPSGPGYKLVIFSRSEDQSSYGMTIVEQSNDHGASNYFLRKASINDFFNEESKRKFQVQAAEAFLIVDSAEEEYEADLYFWSNGHFRREPVDE